MPSKVFICLANSRKLNGRCVAGIEIVDGQPAGWVRPVSNHGHGEVSEADRRYSSGGDPNLRDIVAAEFRHATPHDHQPENWLIDDRYYWERRGRIDWELLSELATPPGRLWGFGQSTYSGYNDRLTPEDAEGFEESLKLIRVAAITLKVFQPGLAFGNAKRRVQGRFQLGWSAVLAMDN